MNKLTKVLVGGCLAAGLANPVSASLITVGGIQFEPGFHIETASIMETAVGEVGNVLSGFGRVDLINGQSFNQYCVSGNCELTFEFGGYETTAIVPGFDPDEPAGARITFDGGWVNFYVKEGRTANFETGDNFTDGTLWLGLVGVTSRGSLTYGNPGVDGTLHSSLSNFDAVSAIDDGIGRGWLNVAETPAGIGLANEIFATQTQTTNLGTAADFLLTSSFQPDEGDEFFLPLAGTADIRGDAQAVPEPGVISLMGLGLLALGLTAVGLRRREPTASQ